MVSLIFTHYVQNSGNRHLFNTTETPESQGDEAFISDMKPLNMCQSRDEILYVFRGCAFPCNVIGGVASLFQ